MKSTLASITIAALLLATLTTVQAGQQPAPPPTPERYFEQAVGRLRTALALNDEQVSRLKEVIEKYAPKVPELRQRAQAVPYSQQLQVDLDRDQREMREEFAAHLSDDQKAKFANADFRLPVPLPPPFVVINIPPRVRTIEDQTRLSGLAAGAKSIASVSSNGKSKVLRLPDDQRILHLLNRITFGPRPGDIERVRQIGIERFIDQQLRPDTLDDSDVETRLAAIPTIRMTSAELYQFYPPPQVVDQRVKDKTPGPVFGRPQQLLTEMVQQKLVRAVSSEKQLQEVMTDFWFNHFNVFAQKEADLWMVTAYERDAIRPNALGRFRDLLEAVAQSPAMLFYLDNWLSAAPDSVQPRPPVPPRPQNQRPPQPPEGVRPPPEAGAASVPGPPIPAPSASGTQETKPREPGQQPGTPNPQTPPPPRPPARKPGINENYARELLELHTMGVSGGYTQKDVQEVARCFTGWTVDRPFQGGGFVFRPWMHDVGSKSVLGITIPAGGGIGDATRVLEILSRHPSTARFVATKLCKRFVSDNPAPQLVERIAQVFLRTDGDLREVLRAVLTSPEMNSASAFRSKVKSPLELVASAIRAVDGDTDGAPALQNWLRRMGEPLYLAQPPTGYGEDSSEWVNTGVFFNRINFSVALAGNQIPGTIYDPGRLVSAQKAASDDEAAAQLTALLVHTELSAESRRALQAGPAVQQVKFEDRPRPAGVTPDQSPITPAGSNKLDAAAAKRVTQLIGVLLGSAEFQRR